MKLRMDGPAALVVTLLLWASAFAGIRAGLEAYTPGQLALLRQFWRLRWTPPSPWYTSGSSPRPWPT